MPHISAAGAGTVLCAIFFLEFHGFGNLYSITPVGASPCEETQIGLGYPLWSETFSGSHASPPQISAEEELRACCRPARTNEEFLQCASAESQTHQSPFGLSNSIHPLQSPFSDGHEDMTRAWDRSVWMAFSAKNRL